MKRVIIFLTALLIGSALNAQVTVDNTSMTVTQYIQNVLAGPGVVITNVTINGSIPAAQLPFEQIGSFNDVSSDVGLASGIILGSGNVAVAAQLNTSGSSSLGGTGNPGVDPDLASITTSTIYDECIVEFDFVPQGDTLTFNYVFASEEYEEFVCGTVNDAFGFFLSGNNPLGGTYNAMNIALIPDPLVPGAYTTTPVSINTVNPGVPGASGTLTNCTAIDPNFASYNIFYTTNTTNTYEYDGKTVVLQARAFVNCNQTYHIKLAIGDGSDGSFDSGVFIEASSFSSNAPVSINFSTATTGGDTVLYEGCTPSVLNLTRSDTVGDLTVHFAITGTATNGVDYSFIADSVTYLSGIDTATLTVIPFTDALLEGSETIIITTTSINSCGNTIISSDSIYIDDIPTLTSISIDTTFKCPYDSVLISANVTGSIAPYNYVWTDSQGNTLLVPDTGDIFVSALLTDTFYVTATGHCNLISVTDTIIVTVDPLFTLTSTQNDTDICKNETVTFSTASSTPGVYTYNWNAQTTVLSSPVNDSISIGTFTTVGYDTVFVTVADVNGFGCTVEDTFVVHTFAIPTIIDRTQDTVICINGNATIFAIAGVSATSVVLKWDNGLIGNGSHVVNPTVSPTKYLVYAENANNCKSEIDTIIIDLFPPIVIDSIYLTDTTVCKGASTTINVKAVGGGAGLIYTWLNGNSGIIGATTVDSFIITPSYDGEIFSVIVSDSCTTPTKTDSIMTHWPDIVVPNYTVTNTEGCYDDLSFNPIFENTTLNLGNMPTSTWDFGNGTTYVWPFAAPFNYHYDDPGVYDITLTVTDATGCEWDTIIADYQITAHDNPQADFSWNPNPTDYLNAEITFNNLTTIVPFYQWTFITDAQNTSTDVHPVFQFPQDHPGNYDVTLVATSKAGCVDSITKIVIIDDVFLFYIPTGFTPDGDGINDSFKVVGEGLDLSNFKMTVFNKWGQLIFESNNPDIGWDGTQSGDLVPDGVYIWKIEAKEAHSPIIHNKDGFITIVK